MGDESGQPEWVTVKTGLFGHSETFIPLREASMDGGDIRVPYEKNRIKDAPRTDGSSGHVEPEQETELYRYYGLEPGWEPAGQSDGDSDRGQPDGDSDRSQSGGDSDRGRSGGGQHVKREGAEPEIRNAEGVRLRKYTVTEHVTMTVPVEREQVEVVHEGGGDPPTTGKEDPHNSESHGRHPEHG